MSLTTLLLFLKASLLAPPVTPVWGWQISQSSDSDSIGSSYSSDSDSSDSDSSDSDSSDSDTSGSDSSGSSDSPYCPPPLPLPPFWAWGYFQTWNPVWAGKSTFPPSSELPNSNF